MMTLLYIAVAVLILLFMITVHELGHYIAGKLLKFKITEFSIGFGKALFKRTNKKTGEVFALRMIPLGGYCAFYGDDADSMAKSEAGGGKSDSGGENGTGTEPVSFMKQAPWKRLIVLFSGAFANFITAIVFSVILLMVFSYNQTVQVENLAETMPAENAWIQTGDNISAVNGEEFTLIKSFQQVMEKYGMDSEIELTVDRDGNVFTQKVVISEITNNGSEYVGIGITGYSIQHVKLGFFEALGTSFKFCFELAWLVLSFLGKLVTGQMPLSDVGGPITTITVMTQQISTSLLNILILVPLISVNLAVFNLLPVPALDGARMVFVGIEWIRKKPIDPKLENKIHAIGLIVLFGFVIIADVNFLIFSRFEMFECLRL